MVIAEAERLAGSDEDTQVQENIGVTISSSDSNEEVPAKAPRLTAKYKSIRKRVRSGGKESPRSQLNNYLANELHGENALTFWRPGGNGCLKYPQLFALAQNVLSVPASSAPVERIFSHGGLIMRPHRARMSSGMLETLMFLKCNQKILK